MALLVVLWALPAHATVFHLGGIDDVSDYTFDGTNGVFTFANAPINGDPTLSGQVTSHDVPGFDFTNVDGFGTDARVAFSLMLGPTQNAGNGDGVSPFVPTSTNADGNIRRAQFLGGPTSADFVIYKPNPGDPNGIAEILLTLDVSYVDITNATRALTGIDPDGTITFGDASPTAVSSLLTVTGGTQAGSVGGIGTEARLSMIIATLTPPLLVNSDFRGYFGDDFVSGVGAVPVAGLAWDLTIVPEPGTASLVGFALLNLALLRRRARRRS